MKILLDTHIFLWFISGSDRLPAEMKESLRNPEHEVYLSVVSIWECIIKHQLGKLPLPKPPGTYLPKQRSLHQFQTLAIDEGSVAQLSKLPPIHKDPFDRMIICQALQHNLTVASVDSAVQSYPGIEFI